MAPPSSIAPYIVAGKDGWSHLNCDAHISIKLHLDALLALFPPGATNPSAIEIHILVPKPDGGSAPETSLPATSSWTPSDGWMTVLFRVKPPTPNPQAVILQHGILDTSAAFYFHPTSANHNLAVILVAKGFDVWLPNSRCQRLTMPSRSVVEALTWAQQDRFWDESTWNDMALRDFPSHVRYVAKLSPGPLGQVSYVGHSQGSTQAFAGLTIPSVATALRGKLKTFVALAPVTTLDFLRTPSRAERLYGYVPRSTTHWCPAWLCRFCPAPLKRWTRWLLLLLTSPTTAILWLFAYAVRFLLGLLLLCPCVARLMDWIFPWGVLINPCGILSLLGARLTNDTSGALTLQTLMVSLVGVERSTTEISSAAIVANSPSLTPGGCSFRNILQWYSVASSGAFAPAPHFRCGRADLPASYSLADMPSPPGRVLLCLGTRDHLGNAADNANLTERMQHNTTAGGGAALPAFLSEPCLLEDYTHLDFTWSVSASAPGGLYDKIAAAL